MTGADIFGDDVRAVLTDVLATAGGDVLVVNPSRETVRTLVDMLGRNGNGSVRLFVDETVLKDLTDDFLVGSELADLIESGRIAVRSLRSVPRHSLVVTETFALSLVESETAVAGLVTEEDSFVRDTVGDYERRWSDAEEFTLRTPPRSRVRETLEADISPAVAADFEEMLSALETARGNGDGLDEVQISLLVAAKNGELLYDISRWGEDIELASKATFSRSKNHLEEHDILDTEKVPIDVGRPRLRLRLGSQELADATPAEIAEIAERKLS